jgi:hypothetical protein
MKKSFQEEIQLLPLVHHRSASPDDGQGGRLLFDYFKIDPEKHIYRAEFIKRNATNDRLFRQLQSKYAAHLAEQSLNEDKPPRLYVDDDVIIYMYGIYPKDVVVELPEDTWDLYPLCSVDEIRRITDVKNIEDCLLLYRCSSIVHNTTVDRVFASRIDKARDWSLTGHYREQDQAIAKYLQALPEPLRHQCEQIGGGFAFLRESNAVCAPTEFGNLIVISESLKYFLYYMNLFIYQGELDGADALRAYWIAVRIDRNKESLDFDIDPRGSVNEETDSYIKNLVDKQLEFVIGHEYAHHLLGHVGDAPVSNIDVLHVLPDNNTPFAGHFSYSKQKELNADRYCLQAPTYSDEERHMIVNAAFHFFICMALAEIPQEFINPMPEWKATHPKPLERLWHLRKCINAKYGYTPKQLKKLVRFIDSFSRFMQSAVLPFHVDTLDIYGSWYLSTSGRRDSMKIDRIDF